MFASGRRCPPPGVDRTLPGPPWPRGRMYPPTGPRGSRFAVVLRDPGRAGPGGLPLASLPLPFAYASASWFCLLHLSSCFCLCPSCLLCILPFPLLPLLGPIWAYGRINKRAYNTNFQVASLPNLKMSVAARTRHYLDQVSVASGVTGIWIPYVMQ